MNIPLPQLGHWQKLQYNKKVNVIPLPKDFKGEESSILNKKKEGDNKESEGISQFHKLLKEISADKSLSFKVPDKLTNPDKLIAEAKENFAAIVKEKYGIYRGITITSSGIISVSVAPKNCSRALRIMDKIIKLLKQRGHNIIVNHNTTHVVIRHEEIKSRLREKLKRITIPHEKYSWNNTEYVPTGILSFKIDEYPKKEFNDTNIQTLEEQIPKIVTKLELVSDKLKRDKEESRIRQIEYRKQREIEEAIKKKHLNEVENFKKLLDDSERWKKASDLRNFIKELESNAIKENKLSEELSNWIKWSNEKADWFDPLVNKTDDLLAEKDKQEIF